LVRSRLKDLTCFYNAALRVYLNIQGVN